MDRCPDEVLLAIFTLSCADDGTTGRSLSGVSRRIHRVSAAVKYKSLAVHGAVQMNALATRLAPPDDGEHKQNVKCSTTAVPKVEHLLLSMNPPEKVEADDSPLNAAVTSQPKAEDDGNRDEEGKSEATDSSDEDDTTEVLERKRLREAADALTPLLALVAPTLRTLFTDFWPHPDASLPSLPRLGTLSLPRVGTVLRLPSPLPSLTRLHLTACSRVSSARPRRSYQEFWETLAASPIHGTLSHLRISGVQFGNAAEFLRILLDVPVDPEGPRKLVDLGGGHMVRVAPVMGAYAHFPPGSDKEQRAMETAAKLPKLKNVWIEGQRYVNGGGCGTNGFAHSAAFSGLWAVAREAQRRNDAGRLVMLPIRDGNYGSEQLLEDWLSYVGGGSGPWTEGPDS